MNRLYNIRGTNGSGKSHIVHEMMKAYPVYEEIWDDRINEQVGIVIPALNVRLLGDYTTQCGGGDWYIAGRSGSKKTINDAEAAILSLWEEGSYRVIFECFMFSGTFGRWNEFGKKLAASHGGGKEIVTYAFLDTPKELCADRIRSRREKRALSLGKELSSLPEFNPQNCYDQHRQGLNIRRNMIADGRHVVDIDHTRSYEHFMEVFLAD